MISVSEYKIEEIIFSSKFSFIKCKTCLERLVKISVLNKYLSDQIDIGSTEIKSMLGHTYFINAGAICEALCYHAILEILDGPQTKIYNDCQKLVSKKAKSKKRFKKISTIKQKSNDGLNEDLYVCIRQPISLNYTSFADLIDILRELNVIDDALLGKVDEIRPLRNFVHLYIVNNTIPNIPIKKSNDIVDKLIKAVSEFIVTYTG